MPIRPPGSHGIPQRTPRERPEVPRASYDWEDAAVTQAPHGPDLAPSTVDPPPASAEVMPDTNPCPAMAMLATQVYGCDLTVDPPHSLHTNASVGLAWTDDRSSQ